MQENEEIGNRTEELFKQEFSKTNHQTSIPESSENTNRISKTILKVVSCFRLQIKVWSCEKAEKKQSHTHLPRAEGKNYSKLFIEVRKGRRKQGSKPCVSWGADRIRILLYKVTLETQRPFQGEILTCFTQSVRGGSLRRKRETWVRNSQFHSERKVLTEEQVRGNGKFHSSNL